MRSLTLPPATTTTAVLLGDDDLVVIDPGSPFPDEQARLDAAIAGAGARVREVWITHHHEDHWAGVEPLRRAGARVCAHERTARLLDGHLAIDRAIPDGEVVSLGAAGRVRALHTPGHASGHLAFQVEQHGALVAGDLVAGVGTVVIDPPDGDMAAYLDTLARLGTLGLRAIWPAHGPIVDDAGGKLREYVAHRAWREARIVDALASEPRPLDAIVEQAYADVAPALRPFGARSALAHLAKLAAEGSALEVAGRWAKR